MLCVCVRVCERVSDCTSYDRSRRVRRLDVSSFAHQLPVSQPICTELKESWRCSSRARCQGHGRRLHAAHASQPSIQKPSSSKHQAAAAVPPAQQWLYTPAEHQAAEQPAFAACTLGRYPPPDHLTEPSRIRSVKVACPQPQIYRERPPHSFPQLLLQLLPQRSRALIATYSSPTRPRTCRALLAGPPALLAVLWLSQWNPHRTTGPPAIPATGFPWPSRASARTTQQGTTEPHHHPERVLSNPPDYIDPRRLTHSHRAVCKSPALPQKPSLRPSPSTLCSPAAQPRTQHSVPASPTPLFWPCWIFARPARANGGWPSLSHHYSTQTQLDLSRSRSISS